MSLASWLWKWRWRAGALALLGAVVHPPITKVYFVSVALYFFVWSQTALVIFLVLMLSIQPGFLGTLILAATSVAVDLILQAIFERKLGGVLGKLLVDKDLADDLPCTGSGNIALPDVPAKPSWNDMFWVVFAKHLLVAWKRKRYMALVFTGLLGNSIAFLWLILFRRIARESQEKGDDDYIGIYFVVAAFCPMYFGIPMVLGASAAVTTDIVEEKETKMKVLQAIYGFHPTLYWLTWTAYFGLVAVLGTFMSVAFSFSWYITVFEKSSMLILTLIFLLGYAQQIAGACCLAVLIDRSQSAYLTVSMVGVVAQGVGMFVNSYSLGIFGNGWTPYLLTCFLPGVSTYSALANTLWNECTESGITFDTWGEAIISVYGTQVTFIPLQDLMVMQLLSLFLYIFLAWYLDQIWPGEFGAPRPFTFLLRPGYWMAQDQQGASRSGAQVGKEQAALEITGLVKAFGKKLAVDHLDLSVEKGEVFALLGHNGAGKTTVFNCITGLYAPTEGEVHIGGRSVRHALEESRSQLAVCPQDSPLYPEFTVERHLFFFGTLMGRQNLTQAVREVLNAVGLHEKRLHLGEQLSGGQQRRLWVATALLGARPLSLLDEPSSGMDPVSRRDLWALILQMRAAGRSTVFTTHYLDEADYLANRKAVLAHGHVRAVGTSHDLKTRFGVGYHLRVEESSSASAATRGALEDTVKQHVPSAQMERDKPTFVLPYTELGSLGPLLTALEERSEELSVGSYDVQMTSLEEVFMELGRRADEEMESCGGSGKGEGGSDRGQSPSRQARPAVPELPHPERRVDVGLWASAQMLRRTRLAAFCSNRLVMLRQLALPVLLIYWAFRERDKHGAAKGAAAAEDYDPAQSSFSNGLLLTAFAIASSGVTSTIVRDVRSKCKHVAVAQGLPPVAFWLGTFMAHYLQLLLPALAVPFFMGRCKCRIMDLEGGPSLVVQECLLYPVGLLLVAYHMTFAMGSSEAAAKYLPLAILSLDVLQSNILTMIGKEAEAYHFIVSLTMACVNPLNSLPGTLFLLDHMQKSRFAHPENNPANANGTVPLLREGREVVSEWSDPRTTYTAMPLKWGVCGTYPLLACLLLLRERWVPEPPEVPEETLGHCHDEEVLEEDRRMRRLATGESKDALDDVAVLGLKHSYSTRRGSVRAVRGVSFGIRSGECFGLLGPNGAGKTTTLAALTGEVGRPSAGELHILGHDVTASGRAAAVRRHVGFCPQVDPLWEDVTGRGHLMFYGLIKGIPRADLPKHVDAVLAQLGFGAADADKLTGTYSGGMRRKLSIAIAIIGRPRVLLLDEPTTAVDAVGKRYLWSVLQSRGTDQCTLLMTHSMEEAEVLCGRIAIQIRGRLRCLGSAARLKARYGAGLLLEVVLGEQERREGSMDSLVSAVRKIFSQEVLLMEKQIDRCLFRLPAITQSGERTTTGKVFLELGKRKEELGLASYSTSQQTLEQLFLRFAQEQEADTASTALPTRL